MTETTIRLAVPSDSDALAVLAAECHRGHGDPSQFFTADAIRRDAFGDAPEFVVLVVEGPDGLIGYALFYDAYEPAYAARGVYLADLYVHAAWRRRGFGRRLIAAVADHGRSRGRRFVWWVTMAGNTGAQALYRTMATVDQSAVAFAVTGEAFHALADGARPRAN